jgi:hypothetical protein
MKRGTQVITALHIALDAAYLSKAWAAIHLGVSRSWLSEVTSGKREASDELLTRMLDLAARIRAAGLCIKKDCNPTY